MSKKTYVRDLMMGNVKSIHESDTALKAAQMMTKHKIGALIVTNDSKHAVGIFTERDLLTKVIAVEGNLQAPVSEYMTKKLVCAQLHDELDTIPHLMIEGGFRHVPVLDGFEPIGILSVRDILRHTMGKDH